ncbi:MAG: Ribonuclease D [Bacteroidetes bacterium ADurb.Bin416]|nr:MAG: Ribonuclease D [Bacteroidetes bacterium ADurb.Bin416]
MQAYPTCISKDAISELPLAFFPGSIVVVETDLQVEKALAFLSMQRLVGFDTETKPVFSKGKKNKVALMQVATEDVCFLFRLNTIGLSDAINDFLGDAAIKKIGLSLRDDFLMLRARNAALKTEGFIDLQDVAKTLGITDSSLQKIYALLFGEKISKSQRLSNWEAIQLTTGQQNYAALDAYACLKIYRKLSAGNLVFVPNSEGSVGDE